MLELDAGRRPSFELNGLLIENAQRTLTRLSLADQAYGYLKSLAPAVPLEDFSVAQRSGPEANLVFETVDGSAARGADRAGALHLSRLPRALPRGARLDRRATGPRPVGARRRGRGPRVRCGVCPARTRVAAALLARFRRRVEAGPRQHQAQGAAGREARVHRALDPLQSHDQPGQGAGQGDRRGDAAHQGGCAGGGSHGRSEGGRGCGGARGAERSSRGPTGSSGSASTSSLNKADGRPGQQGASSVPGANVEAQFDDYADPRRRRAGADRCAGRRVRRNLPEPRRRRAQPAARRSRPPPTSSSRSPTSR